MPLSVPHLKRSSRDLVVYNASHPSVIFGKIKSGALKHWNQNRMVRSVNKWLKVPVQKPNFRSITKNTRKPSGLILPQAGKSFMLIQTTDMMGDLIAENDRLRHIVDQLVRQDERERLISPPR